MEDHFPLHASVGCEECGCVCRDMEPQVGMKREAGVGCLDVKEKFGILRLDVAPSVLRDQLVLDSEHPVARSTVVHSQRFG